MLNQYAVDIPTLPVNLCFSHIIQFLAECQAVLWECRAAMMGRQVFGTRMVFGETFFANPTASSSAPYPQELNPWSSNVSERASPHVMSESQTPVQDQRCQSGPSVRNSVQTNNDCRFQIFILTNSIIQQHLLVGRYYSRLRYVLVHNFLRKLRCGSKVDDLISSCSIRGTQTPDF